MTGLRASDVRVWAAWDGGVLLGVGALKQLSPDHGEIKGRADIVNWFGELHEAMPDARYEPVNAYEMGDTAIDEGYLSGHNTGPLTMPTGEKLPATNKRVRIRGCDLATVEDGHIVEYRLYFDQMDFLDQLGLTPQP